MLDSAVKIVGVSDDHDLVARCEKDAQDALGTGSLGGPLAQPYYLDVTHPDANKGIVVTTLSSFLSVPAAQIASVGDMPNDVLMFRRSGLSIAMGNASREVQAQADLVTDSYDDEGFAKAIERFILPRARAVLPRVVDEAGVIAGRPDLKQRIAKLGTAHRKQGCRAMTERISTEAHTFENAEMLAHSVAEWLCALAQASDRAFAVCLSGGSTPRRLYERLADPGNCVAASFPWCRVHWFWGDERFSAA